MAQAHRGFFDRRWKKRNKFNSVSDQVIREVVSSESLVLGALSSSPVHRALVLVLGTNIAVLLDCSKSSRQCSLPYLLLLIRENPASRGSQSVSSLPHSYQRSTWSLHTLIFCTSVRWNLSILWFLLAGLALQVDSPSSVSSLRTSGRSPTSGWSSLRTPG